MTVREKLTELGIDWSTWEVWTRSGNVTAAERWLDHWTVMDVWPSVSKGFHYDGAPGRRLVIVQEPGTLGRRWGILAIVPGLEAFIS